MGTGYMGADEPVVVPKGPPTGEGVSEQTLTNLNVAPIESKETVETPAPEGSKTPAAGAENKGQNTAPIGETKEVKEPEPKIIEKIVERIVEKHPEFKDEASKTLYDAWVEGRMDEVKAYWREMDKNYDTMSHIDVIREGLTKKNPQWNKDDVELELRSEYGNELEKYDLTQIDQEIQPDVYKEAVAHNAQADKNLLKLQRDARDFRITLKEGQKAIELPKIKNEVPAPAALAAPTKEQLDEAARTWAQSAETQVKDLADYKFQVGDDKNPEEVVFAVTPEDKKARVDAMKTWNGKDMMLRRGWATENADGTLSFNLLNIAKDEHTLDNNEKMVKSAYTQGLTNGRKIEVATIKNIDDQQTRQSAGPGQPEDAGNKVWA